MYSIDVWALICRIPRAARAPNSKIHLPNWALKVRQLEKRLHRSNSAARFQTASKLRQLNYQNALTCRVESKMADDAQNVNIRAPISFERLKLETSNLVCATPTGSTFDLMQKLRQKGHDPS